MLGGVAVAAVWRCPALGEGEPRVQAGPGQSAGAQAGVCGKP